MFEWFVTILIFLGVIAVTAVLFGGWLIVSIVRLVVKSITTLAGAETEPGGTDAARPVRCGNLQCLAGNAAGARFCRRCGTPVRDGAAQPGKVHVRQAAVWLW